VLESWRTPDGKRFLVQVTDGHIFELLYQVQTAAWSIVEK